MAESEPRPLIDVIVPVHGAGAVFRRCAASLIAHADAFGVDALGVNVLGGDVSEALSPGRRWRLVIVLDGPPDAGSVQAVEELRAAARREVAGFEAGRFEAAHFAARAFELEVLEHETALGFVASVNHALRGSDRDVVLLNSDTQVTSGWLGRLRAAAYSESRIATVTPFSNNATICSLPRFLDENALPAGYTVDSFGALVTRVSRREYPRLPTGVGFCLYVKRSVLDELGPFDEAFGVGYGEEVDFCLRAASRGYVHVLDDATFIFHEGSRSFGRRREERVRHGERLVLSRYPDYLRNVAEFIKADPIATARARVLDELRRSAATDERGGGWIAPVVSVGDAGANSDANASSGARGDSGARAGSHARASGRNTPNSGPSAGWPRRVLHVVPAWPPWTNEDAAMSAVRALVRAQGARREVFVYAGMIDPDRATGSAVEYLDGGVRVRLIVARADADEIADAGGGAGSGMRRMVLSRIGLGPDPVGEDFARLVDEVRPQIVHVHDLGGESLDLCGTARARTIRAALKNVDALVIGSQSLADRYAAARLLPRSARVVVVPAAAAGWLKIERVYAEAGNRGSDFGARELP